MAFLSLSIVSDGKRIHGMHSRCLIAATSLCARNSYIDSHDAAICVRSRNRVSRLNVCTGCSLIRCLHIGGLTRDYHRIAALCQ